MSREPATEQDGSLQDGNLQDGNLQDGTAEEASGFRRSFMDLVNRRGRSAQSSATSEPQSEDSAARRSAGPSAPARALGAPAVQLLVYGGLALALAWALLTVFPPPGTEAGLLGGAGGAGGWLARALVLFLALAGMFAPDAGMAGTVCGTYLGYGLRRFATLAGRAGYDGRVTHSGAGLAGAGAVSVAFAFASDPFGAGASALALCGSYLSHLLLDQVSGLHRVRWLWPFEERLRQRAKRSNGPPDVPDPAAAGTAGDGTAGDGSVERAKRAGRGKTPGRSAKSAGAGAGPREGSLSKSSVKPSPDKRRVPSPTYPAAADSSGNEPSGEEPSSGSRSAGRVPPGLRREVNRGRGAGGTEHEGSEDDGT